MAEAAEVRVVRNTFRALQKAYAKHDIKSLDSLVSDLFPPDGEVTIIGTSGMLPMEHEWPVEVKGARALIEGDWRGWGSVYWDVHGARIKVVGEVAWLDATAFVEKDLSKEEVFANHLKYIQNMLEAKVPDEEKVAEIARGASNVLMEVMKGPNFVWPMRFSAVLQRMEGRWVFRQMHFSFPTTRFPDERLLDMKK